jgi:hypothetical protein
VLRDIGQHMRKPRLRIDVVQLGRHDSGQARYGRRSGALVSISKFVDSSRPHSGMKAGNVTQIESNREAAHIEGIRYKTKPHNAPRTARISVRKAAPRYRKSR